MVSDVITLALRICGLVECLSLGTYNIIISPVTGKENLKKGMQRVFVEFPTEALKTVCLPFGCLIDYIYILVEPKHFTIEMSKCMKVNIEHFEKNSIGSEEHSRDLSEASGVANNMFMEWQERVMERKKQS